LALGALWHSMPFGRIFVPYLFPMVAGVSPGCTYTTLKHDKTRYFKKILFAQTAHDPKQ